VPHGHRFPNPNRCKLDLLEVDSVSLDFRVEVVVDEAEQIVDDVDDSIRSGRVGLDDSCLDAVVTRMHCSPTNTLHFTTYLLTNLHVAAWRSATVNADLLQTIR